MLLETQQYPVGELPDVSKSVMLPGNSGSASALAGIMSGKNYAEALRAAAWSPLDAENRPPRARDMSHLDEPVPTAEQSRVSKAAAERRHVATLVRNSAVGYTEPPPQDNPVFMPDPNAPSDGGPSGDLFPQAGDGQPTGNILTNPEEPAPPSSSLDFRKIFGEDDPLKFAF